MPNQMIDEEQLIDTIDSFLLDNVIKKREDGGIIKYRGSKILPHIQTSTATFYNHGGWDFVDSRISYVKYNAPKNGEILINIPKAREEHGLQ